MQQQLLAYDHLVGERSAHLQSLRERWDLLQSPIFSQEEGLSLDTEPYDVSLARLEEADAALDALRGCRARLLGEFARVAAREPPFLSRAAGGRG